jgi:hypothetical protein
MIAWEYAHLLVERDATSGSWRFTWSGTGTVTVAEGCDDVAALNAAGAHGWEVAGVTDAASGAAVRYTLKRPRAAVGAPPERPPASVVKPATEAAAHLREFTEHLHELTALTRQVYALCTRARSALLAGRPHPRVFARLAFEYRPVVARIAVLADKQDRLTILIRDETRLVLRAVKSGTLPAGDGLANFLRAVKALASRCLSAAEKVETMRTSMGALKGRSHDLDEQLDLLRSGLGKLKTGLDRMGQLVKDLDDAGLA